MKQSSEQQEYTAHSKLLKKARKALVKHNSGINNNLTTINPSFTVGYMTGYNNKHLYMGNRPLVYIVIKKWWKKWIGYGVPNQSFIDGFNLGQYAKIKV